MSVHHFLQKFGVKILSLLVISTNCNADVTSSSSAEGCSLLMEVVEETIRVHEGYIPMGAPVPGQRSRTYITERIAGRELEGSVEALRMQVDGIAPMDLDPEQTAAYFRYISGSSERIQPAQKSALMEARAFQLGEAGMAGRSTHGPYSWTQRQVKQKRKILSKQFEESELDDALRSIGVHPASGTKFTGSEKISITGHRPPVDRGLEGIKGGNISINVGGRNLDFFHTKTGNGVESIFLSGRLNGDHSEVRFRVTNDYDEQTKAGVRVLEFQGIYGGPPDQSFENLEIVLMQTAMKLNPNVDFVTFTLRAFPDEEKQVIQNLKAGKRSPEILPTHLRDGFQSSERPLVQLEVEQLRGSGEPYVSITIRNDPENPESVTPRLLLEEDPAGVLKNEFQFRKKEPMLPDYSRRLAGQGFPLKYSDTLMRSKDIRRQLRSRLGNNQYRQYLKQLKDIRSKTLESFSDSEAFRYAQSKETRTSILSQLSGEEAKFYRTVALGRGVNPKFQTNVLFGLIQRADLEFIKRGGEITENGSFRNSDEYDQVFMATMDSSLERAGIKVLDSMKIADPEYQKANIPARVLEEIENANGGRPWAREDGALLGTAWTDMMKNGIAFRESHVPFGGPMRRGEQGIGGHGRDIHLLQMLVAMEAIDSVHGMGTYARYHRTYFPDNGQFWLAGFELGTSVPGTAYLLPTIRRLAQNPRDINPANGTIIPKENGSNEFHQAGPPLLPFIK